MKKEKIEVTLAQQELLELLGVKEVCDYFESLKTIHYLGTYCVGNEKVELWASRRVQDLLDAIQQISMECNCQK